MFFHTDLSPIFVVSEVVFQTHFSIVRVSTPLGGCCEKREISIILSVVSVFRWQLPQNEITDFCFTVLVATYDWFPTDTFVVAQLLFASGILLEL